MDKNSKAYLRAEELDRAGYLPKLQSENRLSEESHEESQDCDMGGTIQVMKDRAEQTLVWMKGTLNLGKDQSDDEFKFNEESNNYKVSMSSKDDNNEVDPEIARDPHLAKQRGDINQMKSIIVQPIHMISATKEEFSKFKELLSLINGTSCAQYTVNRSEDPNLTFTKVCGCVSSAKSVPSSGRGSEVTAAKTFVESEVQSGVTGVSDTRSVPLQEMDNKWNTSSNISLIGFNGERDCSTSKEKGETRAKVTSKNLGISRSEIIQQMSMNPGMDLQELVKVLYKSKGGWNLFNNMYEITQMRPLE